MDYVVIFDAVNKSVFTEKDAWIYALVTLLLFILFKFPQLNPDKKNFSSKQFKNLMIVLFIGFNVTKCTTMRFELERIDSAEKMYIDNLVETIEGVVTDFVPFPYCRHERECFSVNEETFVYTDNVERGGYNTTVRNGGQIREGLQVRISHVKGVILKLEAKANANKPIQ